MFELQDVHYSAIIGILLAIILISLFGRQKQIQSNEYQHKKDDDQVDTPTQIQEPEEVNVIKAIEESDLVHGEKDEILSEENMAPPIKVFSKVKMKKLLEKTQNILNLNDEQIDEIIEKTNKQIIEESVKVNNGQDLEEGVSIFSLIDSFIFIFAVVGTLYFINVYTKGDAGRVLLGLIPKELESLNLKHYLERFR